jgi:hypothetical protein
VIRQRGSHINLRHNRLKTGTLHGILSEVAPDAIDHYRVAHRIDLNSLWDRQRRPAGRSKQCAILLRKGLHMKSSSICASLLIAAAAFAFAQTKAGLTESATIGGKTITIKYASPAVNGRVGKLFGKDGRISQDAHYPVWRAGANAATALHTDADLDLGGLTVPKGDYTLFVNLANPASWELIVNKQTGQSGLDYDSKQDLGHVKMTTGKPAAMVEQLKYTLTSSGGNKGKLELAWENVTASVNFTVK